MCTCKSYNRGIGTTPEVILPRPSWMRDGERINGVPVDACIAPVIRHLWAHGVPTLGSCCSHNGETAAKPNIILPTHFTDILKAKILISQVDQRAFALLQWQLKEV